MIDSSTYQSTVSWLFSLQMFGIKLGLENIRTLLAELGDPQHELAMVHVAGTNGKGSTAAFITAMLAEAGWRTGLYTSPHLVDFRERIRIDGVPISREDVVAYAMRLRPTAERLRATFFEVTTAMALAAFAEAQVQAAVIETGMGGRLDATNIILPRVSVITGIDLEHTEYLGTTLEAIASEKAGIIKGGVPVLTAALQPEVLDVLRETALRADAPFEHVTAEEGAASIRDIDAMELPLRIGGVRMPARVAFAGLHQARNAQLAVAAAETFARCCGAHLNESMVRGGLLRVRERTGLHARIERIASNPELVVDVAHNPAGVAALLATWKAVRDPARTHLVFGMLRTKDIATTASLLQADRWGSITTVAAHDHDTWTAREVAQAVGSDAPQVHEAADPVAGVREALGRAGRDEHILLFGSHYIVGEYIATRT